MPVASENLAFGDALRPAKADFVEIEVGMLGTDVMKDTGHRALHPEIKALDRVGVNRATNIFAASMLHRLVRGKTLTNCDECLPLVAHQVGPWVDLFLEHAFDFIHREIGDHRGPGIAGRRALRSCTGALQTLATTTRRRLVRLLLLPSAEKEFVDLDRAAEWVLARQHQAQRMSKAPRRRLAYPKRFGQANGGQPL